MPEIMRSEATSNRIHAALVAGGMTILLARAAILLTQAWQVLRRWVISLAALELGLDIAAIGASIRWGLTGVRRHRRLTLRLAAAAIIVHAVRVAVFVLGRFRPLKDFDVRPEQRAEHDQRWRWGEVAFAAVMSVLGVVGVLVVRSRVRAGRR